MNWYKKASIRNARYFRGVKKQEAISIMKGKNLTPSTDLIPFDNEVLEYAIGDDYKDMSQEEIDNWIKNVIPWYDGSLASVKGGVNLTTDFENAQGYGDYVLAIEPYNTEVVDVSDAHAFARSAKDLKIIGIYDTKKQKWIYELV